DFKRFREGLPPEFSRKKAMELYDSVRSSMNIKENKVWQIAPKYDFQTLREEYVSKNIFNVGDLVENVNTGLIGRIIRRGTNYLICVTEDNIMFKSWIKDIAEAYTEKIMNRKMRTPKKPNTLFGTGGRTKNAIDAVPGQTQKGLDFINKYRKK
ncbi:MAG: cytidyltransferase, partial [Candidatus Lokiarchaeota archaeon]|nr:cytidyltransferase [Candidatus Lokiarchaeota archaeon]